MNFLVLDTSLISMQHAISDRFISYEDGWQNHWGKLDEHPPNSWHSFAAAMSGRFVSAPLDNWMDHVRWADTILLTWTYSPAESLKVLRLCKKMGKKVIVAFHENGSTVNLLVKNLDWLVDSKKLYLEADYISHYPHKYISFLGEKETKYSQILRIFNTYPDELFVNVHKDDIYLYDYGEEEREQKDKMSNVKKILIGIQYKDNEHENRNFLGNLVEASAFNECDITIINSSSIISNETMQSKMREWFGRDNINVISKTKNWYDFLKLIDEHDGVINNDTSFTQGQVTSDAIFRGKRVLDYSTAHSLTHSIYLINSLNIFKYSDFKGSIENLLR